MLPKRMAQAVLFAALAAALALGLYGGAQAYDWSTATFGSDGETRLDAPIGVDPRGQPMMSLFSCSGPDSDGDTIPDECDDCPLDPYNDYDGDDVCGDVDNCPVHPNPPQKDTDLDGFGDVCDADDDNDGILDDGDDSGTEGDNPCTGGVTEDCDDNCRLTANADQSDMDSDGLGDVCDDSDGDTVVDAEDNCPNDANPDQQDTDSDGDGDVCDDDDDDDGVPDISDNCPVDANPNQQDNDSDGDGDVCDADDDNDSVPDASDNCQYIPNSDQTNTDADLEDNGASVVGDDMGDACDPDDDNDEFHDVREAYLGTDPLDNCPDDSNDDAWPLDINKDTYVTVVGDVLQFVGRIGATGGPPPSSGWWLRLDLNQDNFITVVGDIDPFYVPGIMGQQCQ